MSDHAGRLVVDAAKCDGHGICVLRCPDLLTLDAWGFVGIDTDEPITGRDLRRARSAAAACPERALSVVSVDIKAGLHILPSAHSSTWQTSVNRPEAAGPGQAGRAEGGTRP
ncbi:MAG: ferredoxin [Actinomycetota bacterium]|jgi:ferredoxin|nr:ferredoxin [Actinomycetota bacterium]MDQ1495075.1 ferredoxin [Actinomycetota bacterium]MDQ1539469.1 ferredoxin [Actinomycetota bacterium]